jgi:hypothetical protein
MHVRFVQPVAGARRKQIGRRATFQEAIASLQILDKNFPRRWMNGHQTRLAELGFLNSQHVVVQINVVQLILFLALTTWFGLGYPVARRLGAVQWCLLAAPPIGLAIHGVLTPLIYLHGFTAYLTCAICLGLAAPGVFLGYWDIRRRSLSHNETIIGLATLATFLLVILPNWLGSPEFSVFQGNIGDQFWFLTNAFTMARFDADAIRRMDAGILHIGFPHARRALSMRPEVMLMLAGFASVLRRPVLLTSYAYLASFQVCLFFSSAFVVRNVFDLTPLAALLIAVAVATGFFVQYVFDINAWSHLASIAIATLAVGLFTMQIMGDRVTLKPKDLFLAFAACLAGLIYIYIETLPIIGVVMASMLAYQALRLRPRDLLQRLMPMLLAGVAALMLCALSFDLTINYFVEQTRFLFDPLTVSQTTDWWKYAQAYLFGYDIDPRTGLSSLWTVSPFAALSAALSLATSFLAGALGVYFLQLPPKIPVGYLVLAIVLSVFWYRTLRLPEAAERFTNQRLLAAACCGALAFALLPWLPQPLLPIPIVVRTLWKLLLLTFLVALLLAWAHALSRAAKGPDRIFFAGLAGGFVFIAALVAAQRYWAAGEGLIMLSPVLFIALVGAIWCDPASTRHAMLALGVYLATQLGFGAYRTYAAVAGAYGIHYAPPYPVDAGHKGLYVWDYDSLRTAFRNCARTSIDIEDRYLESFVKMVGTDTGARWSAARLIWFTDRMQRQVENPDCLISTQASDIAAVGPTLIWLRRDRRTLDFYRGISNRLDAVPLMPWELQVQGIAIEESWHFGSAWTDGHARLRIPNNPGIPAKELEIVIDPEHPPNAGITVLINDRVVVKDALGIEQPWHQTIDLREFADAAWLDIGIDSDSFVPKGDTRTRGVRINRLSLTK